MPDSNKFVAIFRSRNKATLFAVVRQSDGFCVYKLKAGETAAEAWRLFRFRDNGGSVGARERATRFAEQDANDA